MYKVDLGPDGCGVGNGISLKVEEGSVFMRVGVRVGDGEFARWLVGEIGDVKVYIQRSEGSREVEILMTKRDVFP